MTTTPDPARIGRAIVEGTFNFDLDETAAILVALCATPRHPETGDLIEKTWRELHAARPEIVAAARPNIYDAAWHIAVAEILTEGKN